VRVNDRPIPARVRNCDHQPNDSAGPLSESRAFELSSSELGLEVEQRALNLDDDALGRRFQRHVSRAPIGRHPNWHLDLNTPTRMRRGSDLIGDAKLSGVSQADSIGRKEANREIVTGGGSQPMHHARARHGPTSLDQAYEALADPRPLRDLFLCQAGDRPGRDKFAREAHRQLMRARAKADARRWHRIMVVGGPQRVITAELPLVC